MPCKLEIRKSIEASIDKYLPDREAVMSSKAANSIKKTLGDLWSVKNLMNVIQYSGTGGYRVVVNPAGMDEAVAKENDSQKKAEERFERDLDFFQGDAALLEQEQREFSRDEYPVLKVERILEENPKLANIGTPEQYSRYLSTIFPDSKVKDILYHGTPDGQFENFDISKSGKLTGTSTKGIYFTDSKITADFYAEGSIDFSQFESREEYEAVKKAKVFPAILDAKNLKLVDNPQAQEKQGDAILRTKDKISDIGLTGYASDLAHQYIVFEPKQIHVLGSKEDVEGFIKFREDSQTYSVDDLSGIDDSYFTSLTNKYYDYVSYEKNKLNGYDTDRLNIIAEVLDETSDQELYTLIKSELATSDEYKQDSSFLSSRDFNSYLGDIKVDAIRRDIEEYKQGNRFKGKDVLISIVDTAFSSYINSLLGLRKPSTMLQKEGTEGSEASPETIAVLKDFLNRIGVEVKTVKEIVKDGIKQNANGAAILTQKLVQVVEGKEDVALGEEAMHWSVEITQQKDPKLFAKMLKEINDYAIYKQVLADYSSDPAYQTKDGKPDILKLKKEAIGKVLYETVIKQNEGITQKPELLEKSLTWWESIIASLRNLFSTSGMDEAAMKVVSGEAVGTADDVRSEDVYYQKTKLTGQEKLNAFYDKYMDVAKRMRLIDYDPDDRHYTIDGRRIRNSVTKWIKRFQANKFVRTDAQKIVDDQKQYWGSDVHSYFEQMAKKSFLTKDGYLKSTPTPYNPKTNLTPEVREVLDGFLAKVFASYPEGTRFVTEEFLLNEKEDVASTLDFMAIVPEGDSFYVEVLDWKTTTIDLEQTEDVPWFKQEEYKKQMKEYVKILQRYGLKPAQIRKARMIPIKANYENVVPEDYNTPLFLESIEIGDLDNAKETQLYLLPVPLDFESTGNKRLDKFIQALRDQYDKFVRRVVDPTQQYLKDAQRQELAKAIRKLHLQMDFAPIASIGNTFLGNGRAVLDKIKERDFSTMSLEEMQEVLKELNYVTTGADKYQEIADVFIFANKDRTLSDEEKQVLSDLERLASRTETLLADALTIKRTYVAQLAVNYGITRENPVESVKRAAAGEMIQEGSILNPERELSGAAKLLQEGADMASRAVNLMQRIWDIGKNNTDRQVGLQIRAFEKVLLAAEKEANAKGVDVYDLIATTGKKGLPRYIEKLSEKFQTEINDARDARDKNFFLNAIDKAKYDALAKEVVDSAIISIDSTPNLTDEDRARKIDRIKNRVLLDRESFSGYNDGLFYKIFYQSIDTDKNASEEYKKMSPAALDLWKFIVEGLNAKAQDLGYIGKADSSFFALMDALTVDKFSDLKNIGSNLGDFFKDTYTVRMAEERNIGKVDRETGKPERDIPRYFTITDRKAHQLSKDLTKVVPLWIKAINEYELRSQMDDVLLTIIAVEKNKGNLMVDKENELLNDMGEPMVTVENKNVEQLETMYDSYILGVNESENSITNKYFKLAFDKTGGLEEDKERRKLGTKKVLKTLTSWTQMLGTGLKLSVGIPNWFGVQFQAFINSGNFYRFREFEKNNARSIIPGVMDDMELGLLDLTMPLNEDVATEERRKIAGKQSTLKWLKTWTFQDAMMVTSSLPEKRLQIANALTFNENTMIVDGKLVNIRQYLTQQDRAAKYQMTESERAELEKTFEARVQELKDTKALKHVADKKDGYVVLPGVSDIEIAKYRIKIKDNYRDMSGQMSQEDKAGYTRDTMASAFMMFKGWIPKQISIRAKDIKYNVKQERWEYGRTRLFGKLLMKYGKSAIDKAINIMNGTDEGLKAMQEILDAKRDDYFERTGEELQINDEEFYDMMRKAVRDQFREVEVVLLTLALYFGSKHFGDDDDEEDEGTKNRWKFISKIMYKTAEEVNFYYNPLSIDGFTNGNLIPGMTIATKAMKIITTGTKEMYGIGVGDQELLDKNYFGKAVLDIIPGPSQFQKEILPNYWPELAKEWGIRVSAEVQRR